MSKYLERPVGNHVTNAILATGGAAEEPSIQTGLTVNSSDNLELGSGVGIESSVTNAFFPVLLLADQQALSGAGAINVTTTYTAWTTTGADAGTLADGAAVGQVKIINQIVDGGDGTLTPSNLNGGTTITFADAGDTAVLVWDGSGWEPIMLLNLADGATAPVLA